MPAPTDNGIGLFVPSSNVWDTSEIYATEVTSPQFKELLVRLYQNLNIMSLALNIKDSGFYVNQEFVNGQVFFPNPTSNYATDTSQPTYRQVTRFVVNFGALPNTGVKAVAHGLTVNAGTTWTRIYATATDTTGLTGIDISRLNASLVVDATNVTITTTANLSNYNLCVVVLEYLTD